MTTTDPQQAAIKRIKARFSAAYPQATFTHHTTPDNSLEAVRCAVVLGELTYVETVATWGDGVHYDRQWDLYVDGCAPGMSLTTMVYNQLAEDAPVGDAVSLALTVLRPERAAAAALWMRLDNMVAKIEADAATERLIYTQKGATPCE